MRCDDDATTCSECHDNYNALHAATFEQLLECSNPTGQHHEAVAQRLHARLALRHARAHNQQVRVVIAGSELVVVGKDLRDDDKRNRICVVWANTCGITPMVRAPPARAAWATAPIMDAALPPERILRALRCMLAQHTRFSGVASVRI